MSLLEAQGRHEHLVEELIAEVERYNSSVDRDLLAHRVAGPADRWLDCDLSPLQPTPTRR